MKKPEQKSTYGNTWESEVSDDGEFIRHQTSFREQVAWMGRPNSNPRLVATICMFPTPAHGHIEH